MKKTVIITGGTRGIGKALVDIFARNNYLIVTCSRRAKDLTELKNSIENKYPGSEVQVFRADLGNRNEVSEFTGFIEHLDINIEILINNAGIYQPGRIHKEPDGRLEEMIENNLYSAYYITRGILHRMIGQGYGHIFNICSTASLTAYADGGSYSISKFALYGMSKTLREEMKSYNIRVTSVLPGATYTSSWDGEDLPAERFIDPEDVAAMIWQCSQLSGNTVVEDLLIRPQLGDI